MALDSPSCACGFTAGQILLPAMALALISALAGYWGALLSAPSLNAGQAIPTSPSMTITT